MAEKRKAARREEISVYRRANKIGLTFKVHNAKRERERKTIHITCRMREYEYACMSFETHVYFYGKLLKNFQIMAFIYFVHSQKKMAQVCKPSLVLGMEPSKVHLLYL